MKTLKEDETMKRKLIFKGKIFTLEQRVVTIRDKEYIRDIIVHPGGVGVLVIIDEKILLVKQVRHSINEETLEIPAGKLEYGEDPDFAGRRELNEEAGYECDQLKPVCAFLSTPGFCDEKIWIYEAVDPVETNHRLDMDEDEEITKVWIDINEAYKMIQEGKIVDGKTIIAIQYAILQRR